MPPAKLLILDAHPDADSLGAAGAKAYAQGAAEHTDVSLIALRELDFDLVLRRGYAAAQPWEPDLERAAQAILDAQHLTLSYPTWWASQPALLRGFIERVFLPQWAFRFQGGPLPEPLLKGRTGRVITTMDSPRWWYFLAQGRAGHQALLRPTLGFVGISRVKLSTLYKVRELDQAKRQAWLERLRRDGQRDALASLKRSLQRG